MGWLKRLYLLLGSAHTSFFISHLMCFSSLALSSPPPLAAGSLAVACFSLNLSDCKLVCSDPGSESTMARIQLSNRMESFFCFGLLDISSYCRVCSCRVSEDAVKCHLEGSIPWCSWNTELLLLNDEVCVCSSCVLANFQPLMLLLLLSHMFHFCSIHWGRLFNFPHWYSTTATVVLFVFRLFVCNESPMLSTSSNHQLLTQLHSSVIGRHNHFLHLCLSLPPCCCTDGLGGALLLLQLLFLAPGHISMWGGKQFLVIASPSWDASDTGCSVIWNIIPLTSEGFSERSIYAFCEGCGVCT